MPARRDARTPHAVAIVFTAIAFVFTSGSATVRRYPDVEAAAAANQAVESHIAAIVNGLLPEHADSSTKWLLADRMSFYKVPAVSIALINNYEIEWARAWGVTEAGGAQPVTPDTLFQAAQVSQCVGAMAVMRLVQEGKLNLDINVNEVLKTWKVQNNEFTGSRLVTLRELLSHSAVTSVPGFSGYNTRVEQPSITQVLKGVPPANSSAVEVQGEPGSKWQYSDGGFEIIHQMVLDVTGVPFPDFMRTTVLKPLDMSHSTFEQPLPEALEARAAAGTFSDGTEVPGRWHVYPEQMAMGLWTTPSDLARFAIALMNAERGIDNPVLSATTAKQMLVPQMDTDDPAFSRSGLGIFVHGEGEKARFFHGGVSEGYRSQLLGYDSGHGIIVMTNSDNGIRLMGEIIRAAEKEYGWPASKPW